MKTTAKIFLIAALFYAPSLFTGLFNDDVFNVYNAKRSGWGFFELASSFVIEPRELHDGVIPDCLGRTTRYFRPLTMASFKLDTALFGTAFNLYHLQNILLAAGMAAMVHLLALRLMPGAAKAYFAGILFAAFPVNFFTVFWISSRTDLLCAFFMLASLLFALRSLDGPAGSVRYAQYSASLALFALSLMAKEASAVMPAVAFIFARYRMAEREDRKAAFAGPLLFSLAYFALFAGYFALRTALLGGIRYPEIDFYTFPLDNPLVLYFAFQKYVWTFLTMTFFVPPFPIKMFFYNPIYNVIFIVAAAAAIWAGRRLASPLEGFGAFRPLLWSAAIALVPTLPLLPGPHYCYIPSIFYCIVIAMYLTREKTGAEGPGPEEARPRKKTEKAYLALYAVAAFLSAAILLAVISFSGRYNTRVCDMIASAVDSYKAGSHYARTKEPPEVYLFDVGGSPMMFEEYRFRYPEKGELKGFVVNFGAALRSAVEPGTGEVTVRATGSPLLSGYIEEFAYCSKFHFREGQVFKCPHYDMVVTKARYNPWTGNTGIDEFKLVFNEKASAPERRIYLDAHIWSAGGAIVPKR